MTLTLQTPMPSYTLKDIPEGLYDRIKENARDHRRSINAEMLHLLERSLVSERVDPEVFLAELRERRASGDLPWVTDQELRRARESGRP